MRGRDLINSLIGVLTRFSKEPVALVGDVEQMFNQVFVKEEHREALRFLCWLDGDLENQPVPHQMTVHIFSANHHHVALTSASVKLRMNLAIFTHLQSQKSFTTTFTWMIVLFLYLLSKKSLLRTNI